VDEILAIDPTKLKFAKKPLRVQPAKTLPTPMARVAPEPKDKAKPARVVVPKGDPQLGDKLKDLSKDERKAAKSADAERQARRLAKKQKRSAMQREEKGAVKLGPTKPSGRKADKAKKGRVRSAHALSKMKGSRE
jgi:nucleolar protein 12